MNAKRERAEKRFLDLLNEFDKSGANAERWKWKFSCLNDKEFDDFMKKMNQDTRRYHIDLQYNQSDSKNDKIFDISHLEKIAKNHKIKLREYVAFPHLNKDDPDNPVITATPVPILYINIRKMQQMVQKKNFSAGTVDSVNPLTGQVTGDSKAASLGDSQTFSLTTTNQHDTIRELLTIRSDNQEGKMKMLDLIEKDGKVNYKDCKVSLDHSQSLQTWKVFMTGAMLKSDTLVQLHKPVDDEDE